MILQLQPDMWSCLPTSFGMVLGLTPKEMFEFIGHDGSAITDINIAEPYRRRSFHPQECVDVAVAHLAFPVLIIPKPVLGGPPENPSLQHLEIEMNPDRLDMYLERPCVFTGTTEGGLGHAVAWHPKEKMIYDPMGHRYPVEDGSFSIHEIYVFF